MSFNPDNKNFYKILLKHERFLDVALQPSSLSYDAAGLRATGVWWNLGVSKSFPIGEVARNIPIETARWSICFITEDDRCYRDECHWSPLKLFLA